MRSLVRRSFFVALVAVSAGAGLLACLEDFKVLAPTADSGTPGVDSSISPVPEAGPGIDSATPDASVDADAGRPPTHCDSVVAPAGSADFFCADFDSMLLAKGWDSVGRTDGGTADQTNVVAVSPPFSFLSNVQGFGAQATLNWAKTGAKAFSEATAIFHINPSQLGGVAPASPGTVELVEITTNNALVSFGFSRGSSMIDGSPYYGYYIANAAFGGAAALVNYKITSAQLVVDVWTEVKLSWLANGHFDVSYNGISVLSQAGFDSNATKVSFRVGAYANGNAQVIPAARLDDVELSIRR